MPTNLKRILPLVSTVVLVTSGCGINAASRAQDGDAASARDAATDGATAAGDSGNPASQNTPLEAGAAVDSGLASASDGGADAGSDAATPIPTVSCGFSNWQTPFTWTPTSVSLAVLQTKPNSDVERYIGSPEVIDRGDTWDMFYAMSDAAKVGRIGRATSSDRGRTWTRSDALLQPYGNYASSFLDTPGALYEDGHFRVYVFGNSKANAAANPSFPTPGGQIGEVGLTGSAWSYPTVEVALPLGPSGAWDALWVESPVVKRVGAQYFMWYTANDSSWVVRHGVATSTDGTTWQKSADNPAISPSADTTRFDSFFPGGPAVAQAPDGTFLMFYACGSRLSAALPPFIANICLATSPAGDGKRFQPLPADAPMFPHSFFEGLTENGTKIANGPINPSVVLDREQGVFKLYYENQSTYIGLLTLPVCTGM